MTLTRLLLLSSTFFAGIMTGGVSFAETNVTAEPQVIGTSVLGGRRVELLSDKTWRFQEIEGSAANCVPVNTMIDFCGSIFDWRPQNTIGTDFLRLFRHDDRNFAGIIYEEIGTLDGMTPDALRSVVVESAAAAAGVPPNELPVAEVEDTVVNGVSGERIVYAARIDGLSVIYINTMVLTQRRTLQIVSWHIGQDITEEMRNLHSAFIESITLRLSESDL